jgi:hypothetical protein
MILTAAAPRFVILSACVCLRFASVFPLIVLPIALETVPPDCPTWGQPDSLVIYYGQAGRSFRHGFSPPDKFAYLSGIKSGIKSGYSEMVLSNFRLPPDCLAI